MTPPRRTVRLRLTLLYGALFLISGIALTGITYALLEQDTAGMGVFHDSHGAAGAFIKNPGARSGGSARVNIESGPNAQPPPLSLAQGEALAQQQHDAEMRQFLVVSGVGLGIMTVISLGLGWIVAGRTLRPLRTITAATRDISATNLHRRLGLGGPPDELKELGDTIDDLLERLDTSFQAQRRFIANASHELRTPLTRQRTVAQVALADPDATVESLRDAHERVLAAGAQQERLIEALLLLARGQAGLDHREPFDLAPLTTHVLQAREPEAQRLSLDLQPEISPAPVTGNRHLTERLITNLVDNALRHNVARGRVEISTHTQNGHSVLSVVNTGPVIPEAMTAQLFQPFRRLNAERTGEGLGLGLSIVQAIATAHDATITTRPLTEGGLAITVHFPRPQ